MTSVAKLQAFGAGAPNCGTDRGLHLREAGGSVGGTTVELFTQAQKQHRVNPLLIRQNLDNQIASSRLEPQVQDYLQLQICQLEKPLLELEATSKTP